MSDSPSRVYLRDGASGELVAADLFDSILPRHLKDYGSAWRSAALDSEEEHDHWDWDRKWSYYTTQLRYQSFAVECQEHVQGLMIVNTIKRCRLPQQANKHLVYVEYLEAAPWNRHALLGHTQYRGVGTVLLAAAIQLSIEEGNGGRIGLHSLPQADAFYRDKCGMTDLGPDTTYEAYPLRYFEMTETQANAFLI